MSADDARVAGFVNDRGGARPYRGRGAQGRARDLRAAGRSGRDFAPTDQTARRGSSPAGSIRKTICSANACPPMRRSPPSRRSLRAARAEAEFHEIVVLRRYDDVMRHSLSVHPRGSGAAFAPGPASRAARGADRRRSICAFSRSTIFTAICGRPPGGIRIADPDDKTKKIMVPAGGAEHMATLVKQLRAGHEEHDLRRGRRPDRRQPVSVGDVPRRADHRIAVDDGAGDFLRRQSRVRRGQGRTAADAEWRLPSDRQLPGTASVPRRQIPLSRRQHDRQEHRQDGVPAL